MGKPLECRFRALGRTTEEGYGGEVAGERWALDAMLRDASIVCALNDGMELSDGDR